MKKILALVLAVVMVAGVLAGCSNSETDTNNSNNSNSNSNSSTNETNSTTTPPSTEDYPTIRVQMSCLNVPADVEMVEEKVSEITREKIGCNVEFIMMEIANQTQQLNLLLSGGDDAIDVFFKTGISATVSAGQALDITDLIEQYKDDIIAKIGEDTFNCGYVNGKYYGVPKLLDQASVATYSLPADIAAEFGYKNGDSLTFDTLDKLLADVHAKYPDVPLIGPNNGTGVISDTRIDQLNTSYFLGVLTNYGQGDTVENYYESEEFLEMMSYVEKWSKAGYYMTDFLNVTEAPIDYISSGKCLGTFASHFSAYLNGIWQSDNFGKEMACFSIFPSSYCKTPSSVYSVNPASKNPDKAVAMLWLLATDEDIVNLMVNGVEGVHYQILEDGSATYADGVDASNVGWCIGYSWANMNSTLSIPFNYPADYYDTLLEANETALKSTAYGFIFDATPVADEIAACTNVYNQYYVPLFSDAIDDYSDMIATLQSEMKAAGIEKIIEAKQEQLNTFLGK